MIDNKFVLDCHVHYALPINPEDIIETIQKSGADAANLVIVPNRKRVSSTFDALKVKDMVKNKYYVFSNLDTSAYFIHKKDLGKAFARYTKRILECGVDGIKIIEGKPTMRRILPIPDFDLPVWEPFFKYVEENKVPILWHVNDPEEFWDPNKAPEFAKLYDWTYTEKDINNEVQYKQIENILERHPNIKIIFAHFFFMSRQLDRLGAMLDKYPNMMVDITPGIEMYEAFSKNIEKTRKFFKKYQDRIIYGTDLGARTTLAGKDELDPIECMNRVNVVQDFVSGNKERVIEADYHFLVNKPPFTLKPLLLDDEIKTKIYGQNFINFVGTPRKINNKLCIKEIKELKKKIFIMSFGDKQIDKSNKDHNDLIRYFKGK